MAVDEYRDAILEAREKGASISGIAKTLGFSRSTVDNALTRWSRPERPNEKEEALEALRRLVES